MVGQVGSYLLVFITLILQVSARHETHLDTEKHYLPSKAFGFCFFGGFVGLVCVWCFVLFFFFFLKPAQIGICYGLDRGMTCPSLSDLLMSGPCNPVF